MENIDVMYASDDNFAEVMATAIVSLLENDLRYHITISYIIMATLQKISLTALHGVALNVNS